MSWNRDNLAVLKSYQDAVAKEFSTKPIARDPDAPKPLGMRRKKYLRIEKRGDDIVCISCGTDLLTYKPDNTVIINDGRASNWIMQFIGPVLGTNVEYKHRSLWIQCSWEREGKEDSGYLPLRAGQVFKWVGRSLVCLTPSFPLRHALNRTATSEVLKQYKEFIKYVKGTAKAFGVGANISLNEVIEKTGNDVKHPDIDYAKVLTGEPDELYKGFLYLAYATCRYNWERELNLASVTAFMAKLKDELYTLRQKEKGDLLIPEVCYEGTIIKDINAKYLTPN